MAQVASISQIQPAIVRRARTGIDHLDWLWGYTQVGNAIPPLFGEQCGEVLKGILE